MAVATVHVYLAAGHLAELAADNSKGHLSQILRGKRSPSLATLVKLAKVLDAEVADLFVRPG
jgi:transcriptional regulator with XRE-family HTH domain